jgi:hypothetical protein
MDNEIVIVGETYMMMGPKWFKKIWLWNQFHEKH